MLNLIVSLLFGEFRSVTFQATSNSHLIKFLPHDDDANGAVSLHDTTGALRMGIDSISIKTCGFSIDLGPDKILCQGEEIELDASTGGAEYFWNDSTNSPKLTISEAGVYWVTTTVNHCVLTDSIHVFTEACDLTIELPNVITPPNGDGINDVFYLQNENGITVTNTNIYNRWGELIFQTANPLIEWNAEGVHEGTYFWNIYYQDVFGNKDMRSGYVTVLR